MQKKLCWKSCTENSNKKNSVDAESALRQLIRGKTEKKERCTE